MRLENKKIRRFADNIMTEDNMTKEDKEFNKFADEHDDCMFYCAKSEEDYEFIKNTLLSENGYL